MPTGGLLRNNITGPRAHEWAHEMFYLPGDRLYTCGHDLNLIYVQ